MLFIRYFLKRYLGYLAAISFLLTGIINFIEFFERFLSAQNSSMTAICYFLIINTLPTLFRVLPIAVWLSGFCLLREWALRGEWDSMMLLSITPEHLLKLFYYTGIAVSLSALCIKEFAVASMSSSAQNFKNEQLKGKSSAHINRRWIPLSEDEYCFIEHYNGLVNIGTGFRFIKLNKHFSHIKQQCDYHTFSIDFNGRSVIGDSSHTLPLPSLCAYLEQEQHPARLTTLTKTLLTSTHYLSAHQRHLVLIEWCKYLCYACDIFFYSVAPLYLFLIFFYTDFKRWIFILLLYPCTTLMMMLNQLAADQFGAFMIFFPYLAIMLIFEKIRRSMNEDLLKKNIIRLQ